MEKQRRALMAARLMLIEGEIQRSEEGVVRLFAKRTIDQTDMLARLPETDAYQSPLAHADTVNRPALPQSRKYPQNVRILPKSRDFH